MTTVLTRESWEKAVFAEMRKRVYPADSDEAIRIEVEGYLERCDVSESPQEVVTDYIEAYDLQDCSDPWVL